VQAASEEIACWRKRKGFSVMNGGRTATAASAGQPMHQPARDKFKKVLLLLRVLENS